MTPYHTSLSSQINFRPKMISNWFDCIFLQVLKSWRKIWNKRINKSNQFEKFKTRFEPQNVPTHQAADPLKLCPNHLHHTIGQVYRLTAHFLNTRSQLSGHKVATVEIDMTIWEHKQQCLPCVGKCTLLSRLQLRHHSCKLP